MTNQFDPMATELRTDRLSMRMWEAADAPWYRALVRERGGEVPSLDDARSRVVALRKTGIDLGIALLPIRTFADDEPIGYAGIILGRSTLEEPEIAYELFKRSHGNGYATEAATVVVDQARASGRRRLWATVGVWNDASFRVLDKLGFERRHSIWEDQGEVVFNVREFTSPS